MAYKNILSRILVSTLLLLLYLISLTNFYLLFFAVTIIYLLILYEILISFKNLLKIIIIYLLISYLSFLIFFIIYFDFYLFNLLVFTIILFDSFSYLNGKLYGKKFIFKNISPKKTLEGYFGGFFFTNLILIIYGMYNQSEQIISFIFTINIIIIISIFGDLIQSYFKRKNKLKDSSSFLLGHGGFFDRFDSFIASIIFLIFYNIL